MPKRPALEIEALHDRWMELLYRPDFRELSRVAQAKEIGVTPWLITKWKQELPSAKWANILKISREIIAEHSLEVDSALLRKALSGDVAAIKLWKESIEGWSPRQNVDVTAHKGNDLSLVEQEELMKTLLQGYTEEQLLKIKSASLPPPPHLPEVKP